MTFFRFAFIRSMRKKFSFAVLCLAPPAMIFIRPLWTSEDGMGFMFYGVVIMYVSFSMVRFLMTDRVTGTVVRIFAAPVTTFQYLFHNLLAFWLMIGVQTVVLTAVGSALYGWGIGLAARLMLCYAVFAVAAIAFSLAWNALFRSKIMSDAVFSIVVSFMMLLGGIFIPISMLPDILRRIGMLFPTYWLTSSLLSVQGRGPGGDYWRSILILLLFSAVFLLYGSKRRLE